MDFYKVLNKKECHYNLQYKFGLNIDPIKFRPSGDCEPGGIYFSREDILTFLYCGPYIRKVTLPEDAQIYENPGEPKKWKANKVILGKREKITAEVIKRLIDEGANPNIGDDYPLRWAAKHGYTEIVKLLLHLSNSKTNNHMALRWAAMNGHTDIVKLLIPVFDPKSYDSIALRHAAENGHTEIVKLLIPVSNPKACYSEALRNAAQSGHTEIVKLLIPVSDPKACNSIALRLAARYGHIDIVKLLIPISNPKANDSEALQWAAGNGYTDIVKLLIPISEIDDEVINYCKVCCKNQKIYNLIISNKSI